MRGDKDQRSICDCRRGRRNDVDGKPRTPQRPIEAHDKIEIGEVLALRLDAPRQRRFHNRRSTPLGARTVSMRASSEESSFEMRATS